MRWGLLLSRQRRVQGLECVEGGGRQGWTMMAALHRVGGSWGALVGQQVGWGVSSSPGLWLEHVDGAWGWVGLRQRGPGRWRAEPVLSLVVTSASPVLVAQLGWEAGWPPCVHARDKDGR